MAESRQDTRRPGKRYQSFQSKIHYRIATLSILETVSKRGRLISEHSLAEWCAQNHLFHVSPLYRFLLHPASRPFCGCFSIPSLSGAHKIACFMYHHSTDSVYTLLPLCRNLTEMLHYKQADLLSRLHVSCTPTLQALRNRES